MEANTVKRAGYGPAARLADTLLRGPRALGAFELTPGAINAAADRISGHRDALPSEVAEPLELLCADLAENPPSALGAAILRTLLVQGLVSRRRLQHVDSRVGLQPTRPPFVLVGWYRTGTTFLQQLLDAVPGYGFVPMHRMLEPIPRRGTRAKAEIGTRLAGLLSPELAVAHPVTAMGPEECWALLLTHLVVEGLAFHWTMPRFEGWLRRVDRRPAYRGWARATAGLEADLGTALVLKDPAHLMGLDALVEALPDAQLIWTHRDPVAAVASYGSVTALQHRNVTGHLAPERAGRVCLDRLDLSLRQGFEFAARLRPGQLVHLSYSDLVADPVEVVRSLCAHFGVRFDADAMALRAAQLREPRQVHRYKLESWGLERSQVETRLHHYSPTWWAKGTGVRSTTPESTPS